MPTDEEIAAAKAADEKAAKEAADREALEAKELGLGDAGKKALEAERLRAKNAERAAADSAKELADLRREKAEAAAAKAAADEADAAKRGEFETLAQKRKEEADAAKADAEAKAKLLERAEARLKAVVDAQVERLKATKNDALIAGFPKDAPLLDQAEWLDDPRTVAAMAAAGETQKVADAKAKPKVPGTPESNGNRKEEVKSLVNSRTF